MPIERLFAFAIFCSATLLFLAQPLAGKILLPTLGGSPAVWSTCLMFFQAVLLLGYAYAHLLATRVRHRWQGWIHAGVLAVASATLPLSTDPGPVGTTDPRWWTLELLATTVGLPFFALAATAPLLQHWFADIRRPGTREAYSLYATSNAGSLLGLLLHPATEPFLSRSALAAGWSASFWTVAALLATTAYVARRQPAAAERSAPTPLTPMTATQASTWIALALVPSALLLGVTQHLTTDVVSAPLLWVVPLTIYLLTFIAAFSSRSGGSTRAWGAAAPAAALLILTLSLGEVRYPVTLVAAIHLAGFAVLAMTCHARLAASRPNPTGLTAYFVCVSIGGALGSVFAGLLAPAIFSSVLEYPIAIGAALLLRPGVTTTDAARPPASRWGWRGAALLAFAAAYGLTVVVNSSPDGTTNPVATWWQSWMGDHESAGRAGRAALVLPVALLLVRRRFALLFTGAAAGLLIGSAVVRTGGDVLERERTFFGVQQVTSVQGGAWHVLTHGTTTHGIQATGGRVRALPTAYYHPTGPLGDVIFTLAAERRLADVGVIGLGAGALAAYAGAGTRMDIFEIDPATIRIATDPRLFTYLTDARSRPGATVRTLATDGRQGVRAQPPGSYDLIVVDAFSSDAIPTHLITSEAIAEYVSRLKSRGVVAFHVSSRFFDLRPVLADVAGHLGLVAFGRTDRDIPAERAAEAMRPSIWVVLARSASDVGQLADAAPRWNRLAPDDDRRVWTDDYANVLGALAR